jgi:putative membrane protein
MPGDFSAHMAVHIAVIALAAPFLAAAFAGSRLDLSSAAPRLFEPITASIVELATVWLWHAPALHAAARNSLAVYASEQATFLLAGMLLWIAALGRAGATRPLGGVAALLFTSMHMTLLGVLFASAPRILYEAHHGPAVASLADQQLGGVIMLLAGGGAYLAGGIWLTVRLLAPRAVDAGART